MATVNLVPTLGFGKSVSAVVLLGFNQADAPVSQGTVLQRFNAAYNRGVTITPSDTVNVDGTTGTGTKPIPCDAIYVGVAGVVAVVLESGIAVPFTVAAGYVLPVRCIRINSTNTTASGLIALYEV